MSLVWYRYLTMSQAAETWSGLELEVYRDNVCTAWVMSGHVLHAMKLRLPTMGASLGSEGGEVLVSTVALLIGTCRVLVAVRSYDMARSEMAKG